MVSFYIIILCISTLFTAWAMLRAGGRIAALTGQPALPLAAGTVGWLAISGFLVVVAAPASLLVASLLLLGVAALPSHRPAARIARWVALPAAIGLGLIALHVPAIPGMPAMAALGACAVLWGGVTASGRYAPPTLGALTLATTATLLPLIVSPLLTPVPSHIPLDAALILSGLVGATLASGAAGRTGAAGLPLAYLLGWLILETAARGAWLPAAISALAWGVGIAYATLHQTETHRA